MEQEQSPVEKFTLDLLELIRKHNSTCPAADMIKSLRHVEMDLLVAMMVTIRLTSEDQLVVREDKTTSE